MVTQYDAARHAPGPHTMFAGTPYAFTGESADDLVRGIFNHHPSAKIYYAKEILKVYVSPKPPRALIEAFANVIEEHGFRLNEAMKILLKSEAFYDPVYKDTVPMNSMEFVAKTSRLIELYNAVNTSTQEYEFQKLGMLYNMAPSVFWYNPDAWSSSSIILEKANIFASILDDNNSQNAASWSAAKALPVGVVTKDQLIDFVQAKVGLTNLSAEQRQAIVSYLSMELQYNGVYQPFTYNNLNPTHQATKGLGVYYLMFISPEFNLL